MYFQALFPMERVIKDHLGFDRVVKMSDEYKEYIGIKTY